jgi:hypothetical protein
MSTLAKSRVKPVLATIAALALGSAAMAMPAAARVSNYRVSHSVSFAAPAHAYATTANSTLSSVVGVGY